MAGFSLRSEPLLRFWMPRALRWPAQKRPTLLRSVSPNERALCKSMGGDCALSCAIRGSPVALCLSVVDAATGLPELVAARNRCGCDSHGAQVTRTRTNVQ